MITWECTGDWRVETLYFWKLTYKISVREFFFFWFFFPVLLFWALGKIETAFCFLLFSFKSETVLLLYKSINSYFKRKLSFTSSAHILSIFVVNIFLKQFLVMNTIILSMAEKKRHLLKERWSFVKRHFHVPLTPAWNKYSKI